MNYEIWQIRTVLTFWMQNVVLLKVCQLINAAYMFCGYQHCSFRDVVNC